MATKSIPKKADITRIAKANVRLQAMQDKVTATVETELEKLNQHMSNHLDGVVEYEVKLDYDSVMLLTVLLDGEDLYDYIGIGPPDTMLTEDEADQILDLYTQLANHLPR